VLHTCQCAGRLTERARPHHPLRTRGLRTLNNAFRALTHKIPTARIVVVTPNHRTYNQPHVIRRHMRPLPPACVVDTTAGLSERASGCYEHDKWLICHGAGAMAAPLTLKVHNLTCHCDIVASGYHSLWRACSRVYAAMITMNSPPKVPELRCRARTSTCAYTSLGMRR
jgi:hypothetical protein